MGKNKDFFLPLSEQKRIKLKKSDIDMKNILLTACIAALSLTACDSKGTAETAEATTATTTATGSSDIAYVQVEAVLAQSDLYNSEGIALKDKTEKAQKSWAQKVGEAVGEALKQAGAATVEVSVRQEIIGHKVQGTTKALPNVKNIIAVSSGKGGVGKSTVSANLALALSLEGARVGVLDADIYGPSQPTMLGAHGQPLSSDGKMMEPLVSHGLEINSIGFMVSEDEPMIWRGPLAAGALTQLLNQTNWHDLDYLIIDMPPGTGDIQLTLSQSVPITGAVVVTTPQDIALIDAKKGLRMFQKVNVPILGIVENMSVFICPKCGEQHHIFGEGGAKRMCEQYGVPLLGELPLSLRIRELADGGNPTVASEPESAEAMMYRRMALQVAGAVARLAKDYTAKMPAIKIVR